MPDDSPPVNINGEKEAVEPVQSPVETNDIPIKESKNARKKRERREKLLNDPIFASDNNNNEKSDKKNDPKPFDYKKVMASVKTFAPKVEQAINTYFNMRRAMIVVPHGDFATIESMTVEKYGKVTFYLDDKLNAIEGTLAEAITFHCIVLSGNTTKFLESFIKKHPNFVSITALFVIVTHMEYTLKQHAALVQEMERRGREAMHNEEKNAKENPSISINDSDSRAS